MIAHTQLDPPGCRALIRRGQIKLAGNRRLKLYGTLHCASGKRLKRENRVFFADETEARQAGYRPCARCLPDKYRLWKNELV